MRTRRTAEPGAEIVLDGGSSVDGDGDLLSYRWQQADGPNALGAPRAGQRLTLTLTDAGTYTFVLTVTDDRGGSDRDSVVVTVDGEESAATPEPADDPNDLPSRIAVQEWNFDSGAEGWSVIDNAARTNPEWVSDAGRPAGHLEIFFVEEAAFVGYWASPLLGDVDLREAGALAFELYSERVDNKPKSDPLVRLRGAGRVLEYPLPTVRTGWNSFRLNFSDGQWRAGVGRATDDDIAAVLADPTALEIRGDFERTTGKLDSVRFETAD